VQGLPAASDFFVIFHLGIVDNPSSLLQDSTRVLSQEGATDSDRIR